MTDFFKSTTAHSHAFFDDTRRYRYYLERRWRGNGVSVRFIMLNPSTADEVSEDPTIRRCIRFAQSFGGAELGVLNLFALRSTDPKALYKSDDPIGAENNRWIDDCCSPEHIVICAWGTHGKHLERGREVLKRLRARGVQPKALSMTASGQPGHPLYLPATSPLMDIPHV